MLIVSVFAVIGIVAPTALPVGFDEKISLGLAANMPDWLARAIACALGGGLAIGLGLAARKFRSRAPIMAAWALIGVSLGWQAVIPIATIWFVLSIVIGRIHRLADVIGPTSILMLAAFIHHPFWKTLSNLW